MNKIQEAEFNILCYFHKFCQKNNLKYSLYAGSLLGAVRHKGFIPWDDDTDVMMKRDEYERFEEVFLKSSYGEDGYSYQSKKLYPYQALPFAKIRSREVNIREIVSKTQRGNHGPWLDIFPLDNVPDDEGLRIKQFKKVSFYNKILKSFLLVIRREEDKGIRGSLKGLVQGFNERFHKYYFFLPYVFKKRHHHMTMYNGSETSHIADISYMFYKSYDDYSKQILKKTIMDNLEAMEFEGQDFCGSRDYDYILSTMYGDYMKLPPLEEQKKHNLEYTSLD